MLEKGLSFASSAGVKRVIEESVVRRIDLRRKISLFVDSLIFGKRERNPRYHRCLLSILAVSADRRIEGEVGRAWNKIEKIRNHTL